MVRALKFLSTRHALRLSVAKRPATVLARSAGDYLAALDSSRAATLDESDHLLRPRHGRCAPLVAELSFCSIPVLPPARFADDATLPRGPRVSMALRTFTQV